VGCRPLPFLLVRLMTSSESMPSGSCATTGSSVPRLRAAVGLRTASRPVALESCGF
jgi:hypothetical protein